MDITTTDEEHLRDYAEDERTGQRIAEVLRLRRDPQHKELWFTTCGGKTSAGIARLVLAIQRGDV